MKRFQGQKQTNREKEKQRELLCKVKFADSLCETPVTLAVVSLDKLDSDWF